MFKKNIPFLFYLLKCMVLFIFAGCINPPHNPISSSDCSLKESIKILRGEIMLNKIQGKSYFEIKNKSKGLLIINPSISSYKGTISNFNDHSFIFKIKNHGMAPVNPYKGKVNLTYFDRLFPKILKVYFKSDVITRIEEIK